jgi:hypothetical protein
MSGSSTHAADSAIHGSLYIATIFTAVVGATGIVGASVTIIA